MTQYYPEFQFQILQVEQQLALHKYLTELGNQLGLQPSPQVSPLVNQLQCFQLGRIQQPLNLTQEQELQLQQLKLQQEQKESDLEMWQLRMRAAELERDNAAIIQQKQQPKPVLQNSQKSSEYTKIKLEKSDPSDRAFSEKRSFNMERKRDGRSKSRYSSDSDRSESSENEKGRNYRTRDRSEDGGKSYRKGESQRDWSEDSYRSSERKKSSKSKHADSDRSDSSENERKSRKRDRSRERERGGRNQHKQQQSYQKNSSSEEENWEVKFPKFERKVEYSSRYSDQSDSLDEKELEKYQRASSEKSRSKTPRRYYLICGPNENSDSNKERRRNEEKRQKEDQYIRKIDFVKSHKEYTTFESDRVTTREESEKSIDPDFDRQLDKEIEDYVETEKASRLDDDDDDDDDEESKENYPCYMDDRVKVEYRIRNLGGDPADCSLSKVTNYYAVYVGRQPGIYSTWKEAQAQVTGFSHQLYEGKKSLAEALQVMLR
jgi:hypothetical protein